VNRPEQKFKRGNVITNREGGLEARQRMRKTGSGRGKNVFRKLDRNHDSQRGRRRGETPANKKKGEKAQKKGGRKRIQDAGKPGSA